MSNGSLQKLDARAAEAFAQIRFSERGIPQRVAKVVQRSLETGLVNQTAAKAFTQWLETSRAMDSKVAWGEARRALQSYAQSSAKDSRWQTPRAFDSQLASQLEPQREAKADRLYSPTVKKILQRTFGADAIPFFELYQDLRRIQQGATPPSNMTERLEQVVQALGRNPGKGITLSIGCQNRMHGAKEIISNYLNELTGDGRSDRGTWNRIGMVYQGMVSDVAKGAGIYLKSVETGSRAERGWNSFWKMSPAEMRLEDIRVENPELHTKLRYRNRLFADIDNALEERVLADHRVPIRSRVFGRLVTIGYDARRNKEYVYDYLQDPQHQTPTLNQWVKERKKQIAKLDRLQKAETLVDVNVKKLRSVTKKKMRELAKEQPNVEYVSLSDDQAVQHGHTRILPTRWVDVDEDTQERVVVGGRFAGVLLNDLIRSSGRMIEGTGFTVEKVRRGVEVPVKDDPSDREPYVQVATVKRGGKKVQQLMVEVPYQINHWTNVRNRVRDLTRRIPDIRYKRGSRNTTFYFEPKYFAAVREALDGSMLLSPAAAGALQTYYRDLTSLQRAMESDNLTYYTPSAIGGFRKTFIAQDGKRMPLQFHAVQQRILARLEANGNRGVVGLGTGGGKTLIAIAMMQKLIRDGVQNAPDNNGRFLFVCPEGDAHNVVSQIERFLDQRSARFLLEHLDVVEYRTLVKAHRSGKLEITDHASGEVVERDFDASQYVSIVFDEAQALKKDSYVATKTPYQIDNPRKILMTASVMDDADPREIYNLVQIANNVDMTDRSQAKEHYAERRKFEKRYTKRIKSRVVGPTDDPVARQEYNTWLNKNVPYIDKRDIPEAPLPQLTRRTVPVRMHPSIEREYRAKAWKLKVAIRGAISLFADQGIKKGSKRAINPAAKDDRVRKVLNHRDRDVRRLDELANTPWKHFSRLGQTSPKLDAMTEIFADRMIETDGKARAVIYAESDRDLLTASAKEMSEKFPGKIHAVCVRSEIRLFRDGEELDTYQGFKLPFTPQPYRPNPKKRESVDNPTYAREQWRGFVMEHIFQSSRGLKDVASISVEGKYYGKALNLQSFDTVFHLDRVKAEEMGQRLGRVWRQGQDKPVAEYTFDIVYKGHRGDQKRYDTTVDDMRRWVQHGQEQIFEEMVREPQSAELGRSYYNMAHLRASLVGLDRQLAQLEEFRDRLRGAA